MKTLLLTAMIALSGLSAHAQMAEFRGASQIDKILSARLMSDGTPISISRYRMPEKLLELMGTWNNYLSESEYRNGAPNALNMLLWFLNMDSFAAEMSSQCVKPTLMINREFTATLKVICQWPAAGAKSEQALQNYWLSLMGYDAPEAEYQAWRDFFLSPAYAGQPAAETLRAMTLALAMNPYFLLEN